MRRPLAVHSLAQSFVRLLRAEHGRRRGVAVQRAPPRRDRQGDARDAQRHPQVRRCRDLRLPLRDPRARGGVGGRQPGVGELLATMFDEVKGNRSFAGQEPTLSSTAALNISEPVHKVVL